MIASRIGGYFAAAVISFVMLAAPAPNASGQGIAGVNIVMLLRLSGDSEALPQLRACLSSRMSQIPDVEIAREPTRGERFIVDIIATNAADRGISASLVVVETFPSEEFRPRMRVGADTEALLATIRYFTLLRLHEIVPGRTAHSVCTKIITEISDKLLPGEYTARDD